jgi:hypothetical protein
MTGSQEDLFLAIRLVDFFSWLSFQESVGRVSNPTHPPKNEPKCLTSLKIRLLILGGGREGEYLIK